MVLNTVYAWIFYSYCWDYNDGTVGPRIGWKCIQKFLHPIRNHPIWIYTSELAKNHPILRNRPNYSITSRNFGPKIKSPYSEITLFEFTLFEDPLYTWQFLALFICHDKVRKNINFSREKREMKNPHSYYTWCWKLTTWTFFIAFLWDNFFGSLKFWEKFIFKNF